MSRVAAFFVRVLERWFPDPYLLAVLLTFITALLALALTSTPPIALLGTRSS
ncbi:MAG: TIGR00366 family protein [Candidatus Xenobia bacterium]